MPHFPMNTGMLVQHSSVTDQEKQKSVEREHPPASVQIKNRRKRYLDTHPEYFGSDLELAGMYCFFAPV